jgi:hypothetical protein
METTETHKREKHYVVYKNVFVMWTVIAGTFIHFLITSTKAKSIVKAYQNLIDRNTAILNIMENKDDEVEIMGVSKDLNFTENMMDAIDLVLEEPDNGKKSFL